MKTKHTAVTIIAFLLISTCGIAQELSSDERCAIKTFVSDLVHDRRDLVAEAVWYPLQRWYPLMPINTEEEFLNHYDEFIDDEYIQAVKQGEWCRIGWRPIMCFFDNSAYVWGEVCDNQLKWEPKGMTEKGKEVYKKSINQQKKRLFPSLKNFERPVIMFTTAKYIIRVDEMQDGSYRYASWKKNSDISTKPDLIVNNGIEEVEGTLLECSYVFNNNGYTYKVFLGSIYGGYAPTISVMKGEKELLEQSGIVLY